MLHIFFNYLYFITMDVHLFLIIEICIEIIVSSHGVVRTAEFPSETPTVQMLDLLFFSHRSLRFSSFLLLILFSIFPSVHIG